MSVTFSCNLGNVGIYQILIGESTISVLCLVLGNMWVSPYNLQVFRADTKTFCSISRIPATEEQLQNDNFEFIWRITKETKTYDELMAN